MKKLPGIVIMVLFLIAPLLSYAEEGTEVFLFHLKTSLKRDDAQICVAYNVIWAALEEGHSVKVLVDADAVNTFKIGWKGRDGIEGYRLPDNLREELALQFDVPKSSVPRTYGEYLLMLRNKGAEFYINRGMLLVSKIGTPENPLEKISAKFFRPVTLKEMARLRAGADHYMAY